MNNYYDSFQIKWVAYIILHHNFIFVLCLQNLTCDVLISFVNIKSRADLRIIHGAREGDLNHRTFSDKIPFQMSHITSSIYLYAVPTPRFITTCSFLTQTWQYLAVPLSSRHEERLQKMDKLAKEGKENNRVKAGPVGKELFEAIPHTESVISHWNFVFKRWY